MTVIFVVHLARQGAAEVVRRAAAHVVAAGHRLLIRESDAAPADGLPPSLAPYLAGSEVPDDVALIISFGGDGTFLRGARLARSLDVPIIGVNVGRLGFLAEIDPEDLDASLLRLLASLKDETLEFESRSTLEVTVRDAEGTVTASMWGLNDVAVEKVARQRLVRFDLHIGTTAFARVAADGVIVATSTGSTAYALSAGGPIVAPSLDVLLVVPVAPHSLFDRTVLADPSQEVRITILEEQEGALVSADGMDPRPVGPGGCVEVTGGGRPVRVARIHPPDFFGRVRRMFRLA